MGDPEDVLIVGASGRAAAESAMRAGYRPWVVDLFGDDDLRACAHRQAVVSDYNQIAGTIRDWPIMPWFAAGAIENYPDVIETLSRQRPYWGNSAGAMENVRRPESLASQLRAAKCPVLETRKSSTPPPPDGRWMLKPLQSAGGRGVVIWDQQARSSNTAPSTMKRAHYFQQRAEGEAISALFVGEAKSNSLVGISKLLLSGDCNTPFGYAGMIGPATLPDTIEGQIEQIGRVVQQSFGLFGLWGIDFVYDGKTAWPVEVNPRYTASVEIYEHAFQTALLPVHRQAFEPVGGLSNFEKTRDPVCVVGKIVLYARHGFLVPAWDGWIDRRDPDLATLRTLADRPAPGSRVREGDPICSLMIGGACESSCRQKLAKTILNMQRHFQAAGIEISQAIDITSLQE